MVISSSLGARRRHDTSRRDSLLVLDEHIHFHLLVLDDELYLN